MANSFFSEPNPTLDKVVREATTFEAMRDELHKAQNMASLEETIVNSGYRPAPVDQTAPLPANSAGVSSPEWKFEKHIQWAESTGKKPITIKAQTQEDLDALERQVLYGR